jgi:predicted GIY-YIG superfamily endonuclease
MCKLYKIKDKTFIVYRIINENYVGVTTNLHKRMLKHKSKSSFDVTAVEILFQTFDLNEALKNELFYQEKYKCIKGIRNQKSLKNPYAKQVLHLPTGFYFDTIKEACEAFNFNYSLVRTNISKTDNKYNLLRLN